MTDTVRIGIIGAGGICRSRHLPGLARVDGARVVAVCNRSRESSQKVAAEFGIPEIEEDWRKLIARPDLDAVLIGTWPYMHREMSVATLDAGKHCFCQARMAMDVKEAREMLTAAERHPGLVNMICPPPHRMPFEPYIRKVLDDGGLGQLTLVELRSGSGGNLNRDRLSWREERRYSGNQILGMGIWAETLNAWVGPYEHLKADLATPIGQKTVDGKPVRIDTPQVVTITGRLAGGALAVEHHSGLMAHKADHGDTLTIHGLGGTMRIEFGGRSRVERAAAGQALTLVSVPSDMQRDWHVEQDFVAAVRAARDGKPWKVSPDFREGLLYMQKVDAVHQSARTGCAVRPGDL